MGEWREMGEGGRWVWGGRRWVRGGSFIFSAHMLVGTIMLFQNRLSVIKLTVVPGYLDYWTVPRLIIS